MSEKKEIKVGQYEIWKLASKIAENLSIETQYSLCKELPEEYHNSVLTEAGDIMDALGLGAQVQIFITILKFLGLKVPKPEELF
ncbi:MAG: hypothetical protein J7L07_05740 [Candidatus Odinarchaeota archaeon]|nr:hypothetical protein [Candidatus Odinarchaeota archaeon]